MFNVCLQEFLNFDILILNLTCRNKVNKYDKKGFISAKEGTFVNEIFVNFFESLLTKLGNVAYLWEMSQIFREISVNLVGKVCDFSHVWDKHFHLISLKAIINLNVINICIEYFIDAQICHLNRKLNINVLKYETQCLKRILIFGYYLSAYNYYLCWESYKKNQTLGELWKLQHWEESPNKFGAFLAEHRYCAFQIWKLAEALLQ